jgi:hypothetical protein
LLSPAPALLCLDSSCPSAAASRTRNSEPKRSGAHTHSESKPSRTKQSAKQARPNSSALTGNEHALPKQGIHHVALAVPIRLHADQDKQGSAELRA